MPDPDSSIFRVPETPGEIRAVLAARGLRPRKRHGQHFLADPRLRDAIVAAAGVGEGDLVLEVGPGLGTLTAGLLRTGAEVVAVEIDRGLAEHLRRAFAGAARLTLLVSDVLDHGDIAPAVREILAGRRPVVVSNLPYSAASPFLAAIARSEAPPERAVVMVQREVALRMCGEPGTRDYGPLAVLLSLAGRVRILREVGGRVFVPSVPVRSAVVEIRFHGGDRAAIRSADAAARMVFRYRRKSLRRALLASGVGREPAEAALHAVGLQADLRPEVVSPEQFASLGRALSEQGQFDFGGIAE